MVIEKERPVAEIAMGTGRSRKDLNFGQVFKGRGKTVFDRLKRTHD